MMPENIIFYFPYNQGAGGVNILFLKLADYLANNTNYNIYIGDYEDGYMVTHNSNPKVREFHLIAKRPLRIPENSVVIFQTTSPWYLSDELELPHNTKILFWNLHPYNLLWYFSFGKLNKSFYQRIGSFYVQCLMKKFASILVENNGIVFMDGENKRSAEAVLGKKIENPFYLPVFTEEQNRYAFKFNNRFAWLGRLADFKISILTYTMAKLSEYSINKKYQIEFYIIGDGPDRNQIKETANACGNEYFNVIFVGEIENNQIDRYLTNTASVLFAMGVSALEGGRIGMPTVLLDFSYQPLKENYMFNYLFETEDYTVGREIGSSAYKDGNHSMGNIIDELRNEDKYRSVCDLCYQYYKSNHDIVSVANKILEAIDQCSLRYDKIKFLRRNLLMNAFKAMKRSN